MALFALAFLFERHNFELLIALVSICFLAYYLLLKSEVSIKEMLIFGLILRLILLPSIPTLSDDYFRFIWDGKMVLNGISPFQYLPSEYINLTSDEQLKKLAHLMNSSNYYSVYPPISQLVYALSALVKAEFFSVIIMRIILISADIIAFVYLRKVLIHFKKNENLVSLYFLNPLVIIELTGNLHFEGLMMAFLLMSINYLVHSKYYHSAVFYSLSVGVKLIPLMFLPLLFFKLSNKWKYAVIVTALIVIQFIPFVDFDLLQKMMKSVNLYFQNFEFNASVYYVLRWIGYQIYGYNVIQILGVSLGLVSLISISLISYINRNQNLFTTFLLLNTIYLILSTTVHPWYLILPLSFSVFTNYRFAFIWSALIFLSYSAYKTNVYQENFWLVGVEYVLVFCYMIFELYKTSNIKHQTSG